MSTQQKNGVITPRRPLTFIVASSACKTHRTSQPRAALRLPWAGFRQAFGLKTRPDFGFPRVALRLPWADIRQAFGLKMAMIETSSKN